MAETGKPKMWREVVVTPVARERWKEITVSIGASLSTLQDIKVVEACGSFSYADSAVPGNVRNRFIYWRSRGDELELIEEGLDAVLEGGRLRYRFADSPVLPGISVSELGRHVVVLVPTTASVHRLVFPHPSSLNPIPSHRQETYSAQETAMTSIFCDASLRGTDSCNAHLLGQSGSGASGLVCAASCVTAEGHAIFTLGTDTGSVLVVRLPPPGTPGAEVEQFEMSASSVMRKLWSGLVPTIMRGDQPTGETAVSMAVLPVRNDVSVFSVCRDCRLRIWSLKSRECMTTFNLLDMTPEGSKAIPAGEGHMLKRISGASLQFCIYLRLTTGNQFLVLDLLPLEGRFKLQHTMSVFGPAEDLVDMEVCGGTLWTLWTSPGGDTTTRCLDLGEERQQWQEVSLQSQGSADILIPPHRDARDVYLEHIFYPGRFDPQTILKALKVFQRGGAGSLVPDASVSVAGLREVVTRAVEAEVRHSAADYELGEDEFCSLMMEHWVRFFSACLQYQQVGAKVKGLLSDPKTGLVAVIRKGSLSYLRPCEIVEALYLSEEARMTQEELEDLCPMDDGWALVRDVNMLCECVRLLGSEVTDEMVMDFTSGLTALKQPNELAHVLLIQLFPASPPRAGEGGLVEELRGKLLGLRSLSHAAEVLSRLLDLAADMPEEDLAAGVEAREGGVMAGLWGGPTGVRLLTGSLTQMLEARFHFARDLLLLLTAISKHGHQWGVHGDLSGVLPALGHLCQTYHLLLWAVSATASTAPSTATMEGNLRQLAALDLRATSSLAAAPFVHSGAAALLGELFVGGVGGAMARGLLWGTEGVTPTPSALWCRHLLPFLTSLAQLLWPHGEVLVFGELLARSCQHGALQEYCRLLSPWCQWNQHSRHFLNGLAHLHFHEPWKAAQSFVKAAQGVAEEPFLHQTVLQAHPDDSNPAHLRILFFLKAIGLFEDRGLLEVAAFLASTAISYSEEDDPNQPTLWSKAFKYHLELGHNDDAFQAMVSNPDSARRRDCLRQLLVVLCERGQLEALVSFTYADLEEEVVSILESRARSVDLTTHNYYDLLYAFHVHRQDFRKAASMMYEQGLRLGSEVGGLQGIQRRAQCLLACLNALRLVQQHNAWILRPSLVPRSATAGEEGGSTKHGLDGQEKEDVPTKPSIVILELADIEKEYMIIDARLRLIRKHPDPAFMAGPNPSAAELVGLLVGAGLFDRAVLLCRRFQLPLQSVFHNLALRCVELARTRGEGGYSLQARDWLQENDTGLQSLPRNASAADEAWMLLRRYLSGLDDSRAMYHRCVAETLLSHAFHLPSWLLNSYKALDTAGLLRVYLSYDRLEETAALATEFLDAVCDSLRGLDRPQFGLKGCSIPRACVVSLPYTPLDQLLGALEEQREDPAYCKLLNEVMDGLDKVQSKLETLSLQVTDTTQG